MLRGVPGCTAIAFTSELSPDAYRRYGLRCTPRVHRPRGAVGPSIGDNAAVADDELREAVEEAEQQLEQAERSLEDLNSEIEHAREHAEEQGD